MDNIELTIIYINARRPVLILIQLLLMRLILYGQFRWPFSLKFCVSLLFQTLGLCAPNSRVQSGSADYSWALARCSVLQCSLGPSVFFVCNGIRLVLFGADGGSWHINWMVLSRLCSFAKVVASLLCVATSICFVLTICLKSTAVIVSRLVFKKGTSVEATRCGFYSVGLWSRDLEWTRGYVKG